MIGEVQTAAADEFYRKSRFSTRGPAGAFVKAVEVLSSIAPCDALLFDLISPYEPSKPNHGRRSPK